MFFSFSGFIINPEKGGKLKSDFVGVNHRLKNKGF